jgi:hypothetical protein
MSVQTLKRRVELQLELECDSILSGCKALNYSIWECCTQRHSKHVLDSVKYTRLGFEKVTASFAKISTLADKQPLRPAVKRSEPNFQLLPLRHHCYSHHLKKNCIGKNKTLIIKNNQRLVGLDGLLLYEYYFSPKVSVASYRHASAFARKKNRKLTGRKCRCLENLT